ncbi:hypothetical protein [Streptomyces roseoverticillatus]|uniref:MalT-like TPR region domain-containing protein n=1 Tax=Streptomyces roseoverticillatus TaxID=66429 RepID=A0ABV3IM91_9ACTN
MGILWRIATELDALGHPNALRRLSGAGEPGNMIELRHQAQILIEDGEFEAAEAVLRELLADCVGGSNWTADIHSLLAQCAVRRDDLDTAIEHARCAYDFALRAGQREGSTRGVLDALLTAREVRRSTPDGRRLAACREAITCAQRLSDRARFTDSIRVLHRLRGELDAFPPQSQARGYSGKIYGLLGLNYFRSGDLDRARTWTHRALEECRNRQDRTGEEVYTANLSEIDRADPS